MKPTTNCSGEGCPICVQIQHCVANFQQRTRLPSVEASVFYSSRKIERGMVENPESVFGYQAVHFADFADFADFA